LTKVIRSVFVPEDGPVGVLVTAGVARVVVFCREGPGDTHPEARTSIVNVTTTRGIRKFMLHRMREVTIYRYCNHPSISPFKAAFF
jgi:hypothetical protein